MKAYFGKASSFAKATEDETKAKCGRFFLGEEGGSKTCILRNEPICNVRKYGGNTQRGNALREHNEDYKWVRFPRNQHSDVLLSATACRIRTRPFDGQWQDNTTLVGSLICHGSGWLSRKRIYFAMAQLLHLLGNLELFFGAWMDAQFSMRCK